MDSLVNEILACLKSIDPNQEIKLKHSVSPGLTADIYLENVKSAIITKSYADYGIIGRVETSQTKSNLNHIILIQEDLWRYHNDKVISKLKSILGRTIKIHGRETVASKIDNNELLTFLLDNHLNIPLKAKYKYGLKCKGELVAVMSFSKGRKIMRDDRLYNSFELLRFCNKLNHTVVGGFSKLLKVFIEEVQPDDVMTYVDIDWSSGNIYEKNGFSLVDQIPPIEFWLDLQTGQRVYPKKLTEDEKKNWKNLIEEKKSLKVMNSGSYKYILLLN